jgi:RIO-like serine/threonine protein kinase
MNKKMSLDLWDSLELTLEKFYNENVYHSDLNSKNIIIDQKNNFYLVDFDNSYFFYKKKLFKKSLIRLERSLSKLDNYKSEMKKIIEKFN